MSSRNRSVYDRLWDKVEVRGPDECWPFTGCVNRHGYGRIGRGGRRGGTTNAQVIVAEQHHGPKPEPHFQARHLCGNRVCCNPAHIAWGNQSANERDKLGHGRSNRGERNGMRKLSVGQVREIRELREQGESQNEVAEKYGITPDAVRAIVTRKRWGWLDAEGGDA